MNIENTIRRAQFCQIKDEVRGSDDYLIVGIDVAKDKHHAFMGTATGKSLLRKLIFENHFVVQCPALCHVVHKFGMPDVLVVIMRRNVDDIIASQKRIRGSALMEVSMN